jgi:hypothetical protein
MYGASMPSPNSIKWALASRVLYAPLEGKEEERKIVEGFLERLQIDVVSISDFECPDFRIEARNASIDLELTTLSSDNTKKGSKEKKTFAKWRKIALQLCERLRRSNSELKSMYGSVFFRKPSSQVLFELNVGEFVEEIARWLEKWKPNISQEELGFFDPQCFPLLSVYVEHISLKYCPAEIDILWWSSDLQVGPVIRSESSLRTLIQRKILKANSYKWRSSSERWLLAYAPGMGQADMISMEEIPEFAALEPFSQIIVWDKFSENIFCVAPKKTVLVEGGRKLYVKRLPLAVQQSLIET